MWTRSPQPLQAAGTTEQTEVTELTMATARSASSTRNAGSTGRRPRPAPRPHTPDRPARARPGSRRRQAARRGSSARHRAHRTGQASGAAPAARARDRADHADRLPCCSRPAPGLPRHAAAVRLHRDCRSCVRRRFQQRHQSTIPGNASAPVAVCPALPFVAQECGTSFRCSRSGRSSLQGKGKGHFRWYCRPACLAGGCPGMQGAALLFL